MADGKLRIQFDLYEIEVNDKGETITLDKNDLDLPFRINDAFMEIEKLAQNIQRQAKVIDKKEGKPHGFLTTKDEEYRKLLKKSYAEQRQIMDKALGEGACQKIFGNHNSPTMFVELMEMLEPHLKAMDFTQSNIEKKIAEKYSDKDDDVMD